MKHTGNLSLVLVLILASVSPAWAQLPKGDAARGAKVFSAMTCDMCHVGGGNCLDPTKGLKGPDFVRQFPSDAQIARVIRKGVPGTAMDSFGKDRLSDKELADVIAYIRSLTPKSGAKGKATKSSAQRGAVTQPKAAAHISVSAQPPASRAPKAH